MTNERDIRTALHHKKLRHLHGRNDTVVIDELGLAHASVIVDVAVVNGCVHGFEIKSAVDTLARLPKQLPHYQDCLEKLTLVCDPKHVRGVEEIVPPWVGIWQVSKGRRGAMEFECVAKGRGNPDIRAERLAHLLWRSEVIQLLLERGVPRKLLRRPRKELYEVLAEHLTVKEITASIRHFMGARSDWRHPPTHA